VFWPPVRPATLTLNEGCENVPGCLGEDPEVNA
jgi:hypothetical protein